MCVVQVDHWLCQSYLVIYSTYASDSCHEWKEWLYKSHSIVYCKPQGEEKSQFEQYFMKQLEFSNSTFIEEAELELVNKVNLILVETTTWKLKVNVFCSVSALCFFLIIVNLVYAFCSDFPRNKLLFEPLALLRFKYFSLPVQNSGHFEKST